MKNWWDIQSVVFSVADHAVYTSELDTPEAVFAFFEKPWKYQELYEAYDNAQSVQGELQDERRATL
jgi:tRNA uridine 5-carbamoylmethylation protein Kti12